MTHPSESCGARHFFRRLVHGERCLCEQMYWFQGTHDGQNEGMSLADPNYSFLGWRAKCDAAATPETRSHA